MKKRIQAHPKKHKVNIVMSKSIRIDNAIAVFDSDAKGEPLTIKKSGNGAAIPFLKRFIGKKAVVFVIN